jgi:hypothetical protein
MKLRNLAAAATTIAMLVGCSKSTESTGPQADAGAAATAEVHDEQAAAALPRTPAPAGARVFIVSPKDGDTVAAPVKVVFGIEGMGLAPAGEKNDVAGHHHLLVDTDLANPGIPIPADDRHIHFGKAQTEAEVALAPGQHTLQLVLGDYLHIPFDPVIASEKITVTVN